MPSFSPSATAQAGFIQGPRIDLAQLITLRHRARDIRLFENRTSHNALSGGHASVFRGRGMNFDEVRIYQPGDDIRSIDWRVTARTAKTHTKIFKEEKERPVLLAVDQRLGMFFGSRCTYKSVLAAELAALLAWAGLNDNDKIGGMVFNDYNHNEIKPKRSKHALLALLKAITDFNQQLFVERPDPKTFTLQAMLERLRHMARPGSAIFLISDFSGYDAEAEKLLFFIKRHTDVYAIRVADSLEQQLPPHPQLTVTDGKNKKQLNTRDQDFLKHYQAAFWQEQQALEKSFTGLAIPSQLVWTHEDPRQLLLSLLKNQFRFKHAP